VVMDPSCGDGRFLAAAACRGAERLIGCDLDAEALDSARASLATATVSASWHWGDFFLVTPDRLGPVDLIIGNPPFIRYQRFSGESRSRALASALRVGARGLKKNYTEALSHEISRLLAATLNDLGLTAARAPVNQHDKTFMGGYGPKGVEASGAAAARPSVGTDESGAAYSQVIRPARGFPDDEALVTVPSGSMLRKRVAKPRPLRASASRVSARSRTHRRTRLQGPSRRASADSRRPGAARRPWQAARRRREGARRSVAGADREAA
jgi:hypothetical protein